MEQEKIYAQHYARRKELRVERRGNVVGPVTILDALPTAAFKVKSWSNGTSPATQTATLAAIRDMGASFESQFDAAHGCRYRLMVYYPKDRAAVVSFGCYNSELE